MMLNGCKYLCVRCGRFFQSEEIAYSDFNGRWRAGFNFQNLGPKLVMTMMI
jgi:hypothetical protein